MVINAKFIINLEHLSVFMPSGDSHSTSYLRSRNVSISIQAYFDTLDLYEPDFLQAGQKLGNVHSTGKGYESLDNPDLITACVAPEVSSSERHT